MLSSTSPPPPGQGSIPHPITFIPPKCFPIGGGGKIKLYAMGSSKSLERRRRKKNIIRPYDLYNDRRPIWSVLALLATTKYTAWIYVCGKRSCNSYVLCGICCCWTSYIGQRATTIYSLNPPPLFLYIRIMALYTPANQPDKTFFLSLSLFLVVCGL